MPFTLAHSPDSDDAFMFHALAIGAIPGALEYRHVLSDIETLNREAEKGTYDLTAVSFHGYAFVADRYALLTTGASFGDGYGPTIVAKTRGDLRGKRIAVPGLRTTAYLAARLWQPEFEAIVKPFDKVVEAVQKGEADAALVIHEGQLTYREQGLDLVVDLGAWWKETRNLPLPLGGNAVRRSLGQGTLAKMATDLRASVEHGLAHRGAALNHALSYARGLDRDKADRFVGMYVNHWTVDFGAVGKEAIRRLLADGARAGVIASPPDIRFVGPDGREA
ncbi:MAG: ABC transporter substrate-binding protein [Planctomycetes bacterium]|nr:ABC transporter substrate-binding protein [Planctomycetota bacterium]